MFCTHRQHAGFERSHQRRWYCWQSSGGASARDGSDNDNDMVSSTASVTPSSPPRPSSTFPCSLLWCRGGATASASASARLSPATLFSSQTLCPLACRYHDILKVPISSPWTPAPLHNPSFKRRLHFYFWPIYHRSCIHGATSSTRQSSPVFPSFLRAQAILGL